MPAVQYVSPHCSLCLEQTRRINFPVQLLRAGVYFSHEHEDHDIAAHGHLEFCLRLSSTEALAVDDFGGKVYRTPFPHLFVKRPGLNHKYIINGRRTAIYMIYPSGSEAVFEQLGIRFDNPAIPLTITPELSSALEYFQSLFQISQQCGTAEKFDITAFRIIENIFLQHIAGTQEEDSTARRIRAIASEMNLQFRDPDFLEKALSRHGFSKRTFQRCWQKYMPCPPAEYMEKIKMNEARRLLANRSLQVQEIAGMLNFSTPSYFIRSFKRCCGTTPARYRNDLAQKT